MENRYLYVLNNKINYYPSSATLVCRSSGSKKAVRLVNLENQVLYLLVKNADVMQTYDDLMTVWPDAKNLEFRQSNSAIARVISKIRKKLRELGCSTDEYILAVPRRGYRIDIEIQIQELEPTDTCRIKGKYFLIRSIHVSLIALAALALIWTALNLTYDQTENVPHTCTTKIYDMVITKTYHPMPPNHRLVSYAGFKQGEQKKLPV